MRRNLNDFIRSDVPKKAMFFGYAPFKLTLISVHYSYTKSVHTILGHYTTLSKNKF